ncbi:hypothetical protein VO54_02204 [Elizabethkingia miricola]|nr:hypothetical protein VO54_02204 [Elizabethkingia miricola]
MEDGIFEGGIEVTEEFDKKAFTEEYKEALTQWKNMKKTGDYPFSEFTDEKFKTLKFFFSNDFLLMVKGPQYLREIKNFHFEGKVDYEYIKVWSERSERIYWFQIYQNLFSDEDYWKNLVDAYKTQYYDSKLPHAILTNLFSSERSGKEYLMNKENKEAYDRLPNNVNIYRGMSVKELNSKKFRLSWTLNKDIAEQFKTRNAVLYNQNTVVHEMQIEKDRILAYLGSEEEEVIILF